MTDDPTTEGQTEMSYIQNGRLLHALFPHKYASPDDGHECFITGDGNCLPDEAPDGEAR